MLDAGLVAVRALIEKRFADEGVELTDADVTAVVVGISAAISQAEEAAVTAVLHMKKRGAK